MPIYFLFHEYSRRGRRHSITYELEASNEDAAVNLLRSSKHGTYIPLAITTDDDKPSAIDINKPPRIRKNDYIYVFNPEDSQIKI